MKGDTGFSEDKDIYLLWGGGRITIPPAQLAREGVSSQACITKIEQRFFFRIKVKTTIIRSSHAKPKTALHTKPWEIHCLMGGRMMTLCQEILPLISVSNEPVSITAGMNWRPLLTVNTNLSQDKMVETRSTEAEIWSRIFSRENVD